MSAVIRENDRPHIDAALGEFVVEVGPTQPGDGLAVGIEVNRLSTRRPHLADVWLQFVELVEDLIGLLVGEVERIVGILVEAQNIGCDVEGGGVIPDSNLPLQCRVPQNLPRGWFWKSELFERVLVVEERVDIPGPGDRIELTILRAQFDEKWQELIEIRQL